MSNEGFKFQASVKDADGDMVNVRADSPGELESALLEFPTVAYAQFKANVRGGQALGGMVVHQTINPAQAEPAPAQAAPTQQWANSAPATQPQWSQPAQQQTAPPAAAPPVMLHPSDTCSACGQRPQYKKVTRKKDNKEFEFWVCPNQSKSGDGHYSELYN